MEVRLAQSVTYQADGIVPIRQIAESLLANERLLTEVGGFLNESVEGLTVGKIQVGVRSIAHESPLREIFFFSLLMTFQESLEEEVPVGLERIFGIEVPDQYDTLITVAILILAFYGVDYAYRKINDGATPRNVNRMFNGLVTEVAGMLGVDEKDVRNSLEERYGGAKIKMLAKSAIQFFSPSKAMGSVPINVGGMRDVSAEVMSEVPSQQNVDDHDPDDISESLENVEIELHAQDVDRPRQGWWGVIPEVSKDRLRMQLYPPIEPKEIYLMARLQGDVILVSKRQEDGEYKPYLFHLVRLHGAS